MSYSPPWLWRKPTRPCSTLSTCRASLLPSGAAEGPGQHPTSPRNPPRRTKGPGEVQVGGDEAASGERVSACCCGVAPPPPPHDSPPHPGTARSTPGQGLRQALGERGDGGCVAKESKQAPCTTAAFIGLRRVYILLSGGEGRNSPWPWPSSQELQGSQARTQGLADQLPGPAPGPRGLGRGLGGNEIQR